VRIEHVEHLLPEYLDGSLTEDLRPGVEAHVKQCALCTSELAALRRTMEALGNHQPSPPASGYFSTVLPRVRERLDQRGASRLFGSPLWLRLALPAAAAAIVLFILLSLPFPAVETESAQNPLQAVVHGTATDELVDVVFDMVPLQPLTTPTVENETSALLGARVLRSDHLLASADIDSIVPDLIVDERMPEGLDSLNDEELEALVQHLGERTTI
jgi:hypothetical protein